MHNEASSIDAKYCIVMSTSQKDKYNKDVLEFIIIEPITLHSH